MHCVSVLAHVDVLYEYLSESASVCLAFQCISRCGCIVSQSVSGLEDNVSLYLHVWE